LPGRSRPCIGLVERPRPTLASLNAQTIARPMDRALNHFGFDQLQHCRRCDGLLARESFNIASRGPGLACARMVCDFCDRAWEVRLAYDPALGQWLIEPAGISEHFAARAVQQVRRRLQRRQHCSA
jgi:hypothetical protein